jgi:hypothetical protein
VAVLAEGGLGELAGVGVELGVGIAEGPLLNAIVNKQPFQGALLKDWAAKLGEDTFHAVRGAVRQGLLQGEAIGDIVRRLRGTKANGFKDGVLAIQRRNAEAVVRTAVSSVANSAREATWKANDDLVKGVQWVSTLDDRTRSSLAFHVASRALFATDETAVRTTASALRRWMASTPSLKPFAFVPRRRRTMSPIASPCRSP